MDLIGTGDFIRADWLAELHEHLLEDGSGLLKPKSNSEVHFILAQQFSAQFEIEGQAGRVDLLVMVPSYELALRLSEIFYKARCPLEMSDVALQMRPDELIQRILDASPESYIVLTGLWTPESAAYNSRFGFRSLHDCFGSLTSEIHAVETGLSSDPGMCWRISDLDDKTMISASAAESVRSLAREFTLFESELSYHGIGLALRQSAPNRVVGTIEQASELGAHFFNGHRNCLIAKSPIETHFEGRRCPSCRKELTIGSFQRMLELTDRSAEELSVSEERGWIRSEHLNKPSFRRMIPLAMIIAATYGIKSKESQTVDRVYEEALSTGLNEKTILLDLTENDLLSLLGQQVTEGILRVREGYFRISPGYDGVPGQLEIFEAEETAELLQLKLF